MPRHLLLLLGLLLLVPATAQAAPNFSLISQFNAAGNVNDIAAGDLLPGPGDDIAVASSGGVEVLGGLGHSGFTWSAALANDHAVAVGDVNGDGLNDIVTVAGTGLFSYVNLGDGRFRPGLVNGTTGVTPTALRLA